MFKSIDDKFEEIGFIKIKENKFGAMYERNLKNLGYIQCLHLMHKENGNHIIQSYQKNINNDGLNNVVGLTIRETKLALKKMKQMGYKEKK